MASSYSQAESVEVVIVIAKMACYFIDRLHRLLGGEYPLLARMEI